MEMLNNVSFSQVVVNTRPEAVATLQGSDQFPQISGTVRFYPAGNGSLVVAEVFNLPTAGAGPFYGFHLHEGESCGSGAGSEPFAASGGHYNPAGVAHPGHAGDFPALLGNRGYAYLSFYTERIHPRDAVGRTVVVHAHGDDFHTQPSGNSGNKLACGEVMQGISPRGQQG